jgi:prolyl-tRNA synthetase
VGYHLTGVNFGRDLVEPALVADIRNVVAGDPSPDGKGPLELCRGIEVGHVFQLGTKYSAAMNVSYVDQQGKPQLMEMGCYGIGITRIVAAAIEQNFDDRGIKFPPALAPFTLAIIPVGYGRSEAVRKYADALYESMLAAGVDVLIDDRDDRIGAMLADQELMGIPYRVVIGDRGLAKGEIEFQARADGIVKQLTVQTAEDFLKSTVCNQN